MADTFHVKPLLRQLQSADRYQVVGLNGHGAKAEEVDSDAERIFRAVDRGVLEHHLRPSALPLILAALPEHHDLFHALSHNRFLVADSVDVHPDAASLDDLRERAWQVVEPSYLARLAELADEFGSAKSRGLDGDEAMIELAESVVRGALERFSARVSRVEVHLSDQNSDKKLGTRNMRCLLEARLVGLEPTAVTHEAATYEEALEGAAGRMQRSLATTLGRLANR